MSKTTLRDVGMAAFYLDTLRKYEDYFNRHPDNSFRLRSSISNEILDIPLNDVIKGEITKFFEERKALNQKIIDDNPDLVEIIENM